MYRRFVDLPIHIRMYILLNSLFTGLFRASVVFVILFTIGDYAITNKLFPKAIASAYMRINELPYLKTGVLIALILSLIWKGILHYLKKGNQTNPRSYKTTPASQLSDVEKQEIMKAARRAMQASLGQQQAAGVPEGTTQSAPQQIPAIPRTMSALSLQERYITLFSRFQFMGQLLGRLHDGNEQQQLQELARETELLLESIRDLTHRTKRPSSMKLMTVGDMISSLMEHYNSTTFTLSSSPDLSQAMSNRAVSLSEANCVESSVKTLSTCIKGNSLCNVNAEESKLQVEFKCINLAEDYTEEGLNEIFKEQGLSNMLAFHAGSFSITRADDTIFFVLNFERV